jgi:hypothetical protein
MHLVIGFMLGRAAFMLLSSLRTSCAILFLDRFKKAFREKFARRLSPKFVLTGVVSFVEKTVCWEVIDILARDLFACDVVIDLEPRTSTFHTSVVMPT